MKNFLLWSLILLPIIGSAQKIGLKKYKLVEDWSEVNNKNPKAMKSFEYETEAHYNKGVTYVFDQGIITEANLRSVVEECKAFLKKHNQHFDHTYFNYSTVKDPTNFRQAVKEISEGKKIEMRWVFSINGQHSVVNLAAGDNDLFEDANIVFLADVYEE